ncbi:unnamed protein product, partial [Polarella glacialis]
ELRQQQEMLGQRLAGARSAAPSLGTQPWQPQAKLAQPKAQPQPRVEQRNRRLSLTEAVQQMSQGSYVWVRCPSDNIPSDDEAHRILGARLGDELRLSQAHLTGEGSLASGFLRAARAEELRDPTAAVSDKWISIDVVCLWEALSDYVPDESLPDPSKFLPLKKGQS